MNQDLGCKLEYGISAGIWDFGCCLGSGLVFGIYGGNWDFNCDLGFGPECQSLDGIYGN